MIILKVDLMVLTTKHMELSIRRKSLEVKHAIMTSKSLKDLPSKIVQAQYRWHIEGNFIEKYSDRKKFNEKKEIL